MKTFKIQVFRISDNKQLYGLYCKEADRSMRLAEANLLHGSGTTLVNDDITDELAAEEQVYLDRMDKIKDPQTPVGQRIQALIEYLKLD